jgi:hypothetical protein
MVWQELWGGAAVTADRDALGGAGKQRALVSDIPLERSAWVIRVARMRQRAKECVVTEETAAETLFIAKITSGLDPPLQYMRVSKSAAVASGNEAAKIRRSVVNGAPPR